MRCQLAVCLLIERIVGLGRLHRGWILLRSYYGLAVELLQSRQTSRDLAPPLLHLQMPSCKHQCRGSAEYLPRNTALIAPLSVPRDSRRAGFRRIADPWCSAAPAAALIRSTLAPDCSTCRAHGDSSSPGCPSSSRCNCRRSRAHRECPPRAQVRRNPWLNYGPATESSGFSATRHLREKRYVFRLKTNLNI